MSIENIKQILENSLYKTTQEKDDFEKGTKKIATGFALTFFSLIMLINWGKNKQVAKLYFKTDKKLRLNTIGDDNNDISLYVKYFIENGGFKKTSTGKQITRFLVKLKQGGIDKLDLEFVDNWIDDMTPVMRKNIAPKVRKLLKQFRKNKTGMQPRDYFLAKEYYILLRTKYKYSDEAVSVLRRSGLMTDTELDEIDKTTNMKLGKSTDSSKQKQKSINKQTPKQVAPIVPKPKMVPVTKDTSNKDVSDVADNVDVDNKAGDDLNIDKTTRPETINIDSAMKSDIDINSIETADDGMSSLLAIISYKDNTASLIRIKEAEHLANEYVKLENNENIVKYIDRIIYSAISVIANNGYVGGIHTGHVGKIVGLCIKNYIVDGELDVEGYERFSKSIFLNLEDRFKNIAKAYNEKENVNVDIDDYMQRSGRLLREPKSPLYEYSKQTLKRRLLSQNNRYIKGSSDYLVVNDGVVEGRVIDDKVHLRNLVDGVKNNKDLAKYFDQTFVVLAEMNEMFDDEEYKILDEIRTLIVNEENVKSNFRGSVTRKLNEVKALKKDLMVDMILANIDRKPKTYDKLFEKAPQYIKTAIRTKSKDILIVGESMKNGTLETDFVQRDLSNGEIINLLKFNDFESTIKESGFKVTRLSKTKPFSTWMKENRKASKKFFEGNDIFKLHVDENEIDGDEKIRLSKEMAETYNGKHSGLVPLVQREFTVTLDDDQYQEWAEFNRERREGKWEVDKFFHGTSSIAASMILRFGFRKITRDVGAVKITGKALGNGIYLAKNIDKAMLYATEQGYVRHAGQEGFVFKIDGILGVDGVDYRSNTSRGIGWRAANWKSREWVAYRPEKSLKIVKAYLVKSIHIDTLNNIDKWEESMYADGNILNESKIVDTTATIIFNSDKILTNENKLVDIATTDFDSTQLEVDSIGGRYAVTINLIGGSDAKRYGGKTYTMMSPFSHVSSKQFDVHSLYIKYVINNLKINPLIENMS